MLAMSNSLSSSRHFPGVRLFAQVNEKFNLLEKVVAGNSNKPYAFFDFDGM